MAKTDYENMSCDVVIAGCGVAGLYAALNLPTTTRVVMLSKGNVDECDSMLAQGGICVLPEGDDYEAFFADTMHAGHSANRRESVDIMIRSSRSVINDLLALGVDFERKADDSLDFTREGAHSRPRIAYHADITGKEITTKLLAAVRRLPNVQILEHVAMVDIIEEERDGAPACAGIVAVPVTEETSTAPADELSGAVGEAAALTRKVAAAQGRGEGASADEGAEAAGTSDGAAADNKAPASASGADGTPFEIRARHTLWATGGIGGVYDHSTNYPQLTGDACYIAAEHGIELEDLDCVQIHPTGLFSPQPGRTFLISESCRGEGAVLLNAAGERFTDELRPRDVVAAAIKEQMKKDGTEYEQLSFEPVPREVVTGHFANIRARCLEDGRDILSEPIPVVPTQHYFMGGVHVDKDGRTSMPGLFAAGETACNGVHGKNRLASNSLLESLVWGRRAAYRMRTGASLPVEVAGEPALDGQHRIWVVADAEAGAGGQAAEERGSSTRPEDAPLAIDTLTAEDGTAVSETLHMGTAPLSTSASANSSSKEA